MQKKQSGTREAGDSLPPRLVSAKLQRRRKGVSPETGSRGKVECQSPLSPVFTGSVMFRSFRGAYAPRY